MAIKNSKFESETNGLKSRTKSLKRAPKLKQVAFKDTLVSRKLLVELMDDNDMSDHCSNNSDGNSNDTSNKISRRIKDPEVIRIIAAIKDFVRKRGYIPRIIDFVEERKHNGSIPSMYSIAIHIGSWREALKLAGYSPRRQGGYSSSSIIREKMIYEGVLFYKIHKSLPSSCEWEQFHIEYKAVSKQWIFVQFRKWSVFLNKVRQAIEVTDEELREQVKEEYISIVVDMGRIPTATVINRLYKHNKIRFSPYLIRYLFGSHNNLIAAVTDDIRKIMVQELEGLLEENKALSLMQWLKKTKISYKLIKEFFGTWEKFKKEARAKKTESHKSIYSIEQDISKQGTKRQKIEEMDRQDNKRKSNRSRQEEIMIIIDSLREFVIANGYIPTTRDWQEVSKHNTNLPNFNKIYSYFDSWESFIIAAGFDPLVYIKKFPNSKDSKIVIRHLRILRKILGRIPTEDDWEQGSVKYKLIPFIKSEKIINMFGDWKSAINAAGLISPQTLSSL